MYRALYAYKSQLPKYLSFEAGDRFTLVDTSVSEQWFLAQNGFGGIGFVPFNYIKKIEATTEQQVKFIDGAMEAIHLQATNSGGQYSHEQRLIMKKLVKHRADVIKSASASEGSSGKSSGRRRPAPAPPVDRSASLDATSGGRPASLGAVGRSATLANPPGTGSNRGDEKRADHKKTSSQSKLDKSSSSRTVDPKRMSLQTENVKKENVVDENVTRSVSLTNNIGQPSSLVSSVSSNASEFTTTDDSYSLENNNPFEMDEPCEDLPPTEQMPEQSSVKDCENASEASSETSSKHSTGRLQSEDDPPPPPVEETCPEQYESQPPPPPCTTADNVAASSREDDVDPLPPPLQSGNMEESYESTASTMSAVNDFELPLDDFPPPPPEVYDDINDEQFAVDNSLPPAPIDLTPTEEISGSVQLFNSSNSEEIQRYKKKAIEECSCDDFQPKFIPDGPFFAQGSLQLPSSHKVKVTKKTRRDPGILTSLLRDDGKGDDLEARKMSVENYEKAQAHGVDVTHADCEEMIGEFRKMTNLSHEDSHWALMSAMNLLADKVPHIKPSLEVLALRFNMAHKCHSTGRDYQCEDTVTMDRLMAELSAVTNDSQQRGHYLEDDLDNIIDIITGLSETLSNAKHCVSVAAIQKDGYHMMELIAKYYQMETRWIIHSCLLLLIEIICRLNPQAILEFLYSELPQELVAEMQQHHNDDARFLLVSKTLGIIFMRAKPSPHKLSLAMDLHFFIWLLGMIENLAEVSRDSDVEVVVALVCAYHLQHQGTSQNPVTEALKMAQGHTLIESALMFLSKHEDPTSVLNSGIQPKCNSVILLLTHMYDHPDTSDLLYTNDVEALIGIFEEYLRDLGRDDPVRVEMLGLVENFMRNYPDTVSFRMAISSRLGPLLVTIREEKGPVGEIAARILDDNIILFDDV